MQRIIIIETAEELITFAIPTEANDIATDTPFLGYSAKLVFDGELLSLEGANGFQLSEDINTNDVIREMAKRCNLDIEFL